MSDMTIRRQHALGLPAARQVCERWVEQARAHHGMQCEIERGAALDVVRFSTAGVHGELRVTGDLFELQAHLSFLMRGFRPRIEEEVNRNLDLLLGGPAQGEG